MKTSSRAKLSRKSAKPEADGKLGAMSPDQQPRGKPATSSAAPTRAHQPPPVSVNETVVFQVWDAVCETEGIALVRQGTSQEAHQAASAHRQTFPDHSVSVTEEGVS